MTTLLLAPFSASFADAVHARRALGLLALFAERPMRATIREPFPGKPAIIDIDITDDREDQVARLIRMAGGQRVNPAA